MIRSLALSCAVLLAVAATSVRAQLEPQEKRANEAHTPELIDDAEHINFYGPTIARVATRDTDHFKRDISHAGMMLHYGSPYDFIALGASRNEFRQGNWSVGVNSIVLAGRKIDRRTAAGFTGRLAVTTNTDKPAWHGEATWNIRLTETTGVELIANRDAVETVGALQEGIISNFLGVSVDHALTERLTLIAMPTYRRFTDGNAERGGRGWLTYNLFPEQGIGVELKGRFYNGDGDSNGLYFSPERYERYEAGLRLRRAFGNWRVIGNVAFGEERIDREIENPTTTATLTAQRSFTNNVTAGVQLAYLRAAGAGSASNTSADYAWRMGRLFLVIPFD